MRLRGTETRDALRDSVQRLVHGHTSVSDSETESQGESAVENNGPADTDSTQNDAESSNSAA